ncbi:MAG: hypothetical protein ACT4PT_12485 [Methanobacteriota archaeon]
MDAKGTFKIAAATAAGGAVASEVGRGFGWVIPGTRLRRIPREPEAGGHGHRPPSRWWALLFVAFLFGTAVPVVALTMFSLPTALVSIFEGGTGASRFAVDAYDVKVKGSDKVDVSLTLRNADGAPHAGNATVQLLDAAGAVLTEQTKAVPSTAGGGSSAFAYNFQQPGLASAYNRSFLVVQDSS